MSKSPKAFNRLYVNMIKAGEAGGALEIILQRLAEFQERAQSLKRKIKGAMIYPIVVVSVAVGILTFIMIKIVPSFEKIFNDFDTELPPMTLVLITISNLAVDYLVLDSRHSRRVVAVHQAAAQVQRRPRWAGTCSRSRCRSSAPWSKRTSWPAPPARWAPWSPAACRFSKRSNITRETAGNAMFEYLFGKISESIREGESIAKPMKEYSQDGAFILSALSSGSSSLPGRSGCCCTWAV